MGTYFHTKIQSKAIDGCPDIFSICYSQISGIFYACFLTPLIKGEKSVSFCLIQAWGFLMLNI